MIARCARRAAYAAAFAIAAATVPGTSRSQSPDAIWETAHGGPRNSSFALVESAPAGAGSVSVPNLGPIADGAGPVIAGDGTVYLATMLGALHALKPDGSKLWSRQLDGEERIIASPAIGGNGNGKIYVISQVPQKDGAGRITSFQSKFLVFAPGGGLLWQGPFPGVNGRQPAFAPAAPSIWRSGTAEETVIVPAIYKIPKAPGYEVRIVAFGPNGGAIDSERVSVVVPTVTGDSDIFTTEIPPDLPSGDARLPLGAKAPFPQALTGAGIWVSDGVNQLVGFSFSPQHGFSENGDQRFSVGSRLLLSPPMAVGTRTDPGPVSIVVTTNAGQALFYSGGSGLQRTIGNVGQVEAAMAQMGEAFDLVLVSRRPRELVVLRPDGLGPKTRLPLPGESFVSAAVTFNHLYVATSNALLTYFIGTTPITLVQRFDWYGGGRTYPAVGPYGHVYAIASHTLFVFPPPKSPVNMALKTNAIKVLSTGGSTAGVDASPTATATAPAVAIAPAPSPETATKPAGLQRYKAPKGPTGLALYACTEVGGDTCERPVASAFCQAQGYAKIGKYATDNKKTKAETLSGEICTKKRCRVFEYIDCRS